MKLTNIEELSQKKHGTLSGGQQQRVAITRALVQSPEVLLLDEPLSNLDARLRLKIREEIRRLVKEVGITTIFVTHDQKKLFLSVIRSFWWTKGSFSKMMIRKTFT